MAVIGTLRAVFQLDTKEAQGNADRLAGKLKGQLAGSFDGVISRGGKFGQILGAMGPGGVIAAAGIGAAAVAVGKLVRITAEFTRLGADMIDLSSKTQLSTDALQKLGFAGEQVGVNLDATADSVLRLGRRAGAELPETVKWLERIGLSVEDVIAADPETAFRMVADGIGNITNPATQAAAAMGIFGDKGLQILPLIRSDIDKTVTEFERLGGVIDKDLLLSAKHLDDQMTSLSAVWKAMKAEVAGATIPTLSTLADTILILREANVDLEEEPASKPDFWDKLGKGIKAGLLPAVFEIQRARREIELLNVAMEGIEGTLRDIPQAPPGGGGEGSSYLPSGMVDIDEWFKQAEKDAKKAGSILDQQLARIKKGLKGVGEETDVLIAKHRKHGREIFLPPQMQGTGEDYIEAVFNPQKLGRFTVGIRDVREGTSEVVEEFISFGEQLDNVSNLFHVMGIDANSVFGQILGGLTGVGGALSELSGIGAGAGGGIMAGLKETFKQGKGEGEGILGMLGGVAGMIPVIGSFVGPAIQGIKALVGKIFSGPDIARDIARDMGPQISKGLEDAIKQSERPAQLAIADIFREGFKSGTATVDELAREMGDLFSMLERGEVSKPEVVQALEESVPLLIQNLGELGEAGEAEIQRVIAAAERMGVEFEGLSDLLQTTFAPDTMEEIAKQFEMTNDEVRKLSELLGIQIQTDLERLAASVGLSVDDFKKLGAAVEEQFGVPMASIDELLESMGITAAELAEALGVEVTGGAGTVEEETAAARDRLREGADHAERMERALGDAARNAGNIHIPSGQIPGMASGALVTKPQVAMVGEAGPEVVTPVRALFTDFADVVASKVALPPSGSPQAGGPGGGGKWEIHVHGSIFASEDAVQVAVEKAVDRIYEYNGRNVAGRIKDKQDWR